MRYWFGVLCLMVFCFGMQAPATAQEEADFIPITPDNVGDIVPLYALPLEFPRVFPSSFSEDGQRFAVGGHVVDFTTAETLLFRDSRIYFGAADDEISVAFANSTTTYNTTTGEQYATTHSILKHDLIILSPDGQYGVTQNGLLVDTGTGETTILERYGAGGLPEVDFSPDGRYLAWRIERNRVGVIDLETQAIIYRVMFEGRPFFMADSSLVICSGRLILIDTLSGDVLDSADGQNQCLLSPDLTSFVYYKMQYSVYDTPNAVIFHVQDEALVQAGSVPLPISTRINPVYTADSSRIIFLASTNTHNTTVYDIAQAASIGEIAESLLGGQTSSDGRLLVTTSDRRGEIKLWDLQAAAIQPLLTLAGDEAFLSPDDSTLAIRMGTTWLFYGIPTAERPRQPFVVPGEIRPSSINVRAEPDSNAEVIGAASGRVLIGGYQGGFFYLPEMGGWVRSEADYVRLPQNFSPDYFADVIALELPSFTEIIPIATVQTDPPPLDLSGVDLLARYTPADRTPMPDARGLTVITPENAVDIALLDVESFHPTMWNILQTARIRPEQQQVWAIDVVNYSQPRMLTVYDYAGLTRVEIDSLPALERRDFQSSADGEIVVYADNNLLVWGYHTGTGETWEIIQGRDFSFSFMLHPSGRLMVGRTSSREATQVYDVLTGTAYAELPSRQIANLAFGNEREIVALYDQLIYIFNLNTGETLHFTTTIIHNPVLRFSPDDRYLLITSRTMIQVYDLQTDEMLWSVHSATSQIDQSALLSDITITPDGRFVVSKRGATLIFFDITSGTPEYIYDVPPFLSSYAISPDGRLLALPNPLSIWDLTTGQQLVELSYSVTNLFFTPDGTTVIGDIRNGLAVFGIADATRATWEPVVGRIRPQSVTVRAAPTVDAPEVGLASGEVLVGGISASRQALYLPEYDGWIWSDAVYIDLGDSTLQDLPIIHTR